MKPSWIKYPCIALAAGCLLSGGPNLSYAADGWCGKGSTGCTATVSCHADQGDGNSCAAKGQSSNGNPCYCCQSVQTTDKDGKVTGCSACANGKSGATYASDPDGDGPLKKGDPIPCQQAGYPHVTPKGEPIKPKEKTKAQKDEIIRGNILNEIDGLRF